MDILSLINDVADDVSVSDKKQEEPCGYTIERGIDIESLHKLISEAGDLRLAPSYTFAEFRQPTPEHPLTATEMMERVRIFRNGTGLLSVPRRTWQDEVREWQRYQIVDDLRGLPLQPLRLEPEPEPHQEMWMHDNPLAVRW